MTFQVKILQAEVAFTFIWIALNVIQVFVEWLIIKSRGECINQSGGLFWRNAHIKKEKKKKKKKRNTECLNEQRTLLSYCDTVVKTVCQPLYQEASTTSYKLFNHQTWWKKQTAFLGCAWTKHEYQLCIMPVFHHVFCYYCKWCLMPDYSRHFTIFNLSFVKVWRLKSSSSKET